MPSKNLLEEITLQNDNQPIMQRSLDLVFRVLLPKDKKFFPLFDKATANVVLTAKTFEAAVKADAVTRMQLLEKIDFLEKQGDEITHAIMNAAASTFIVPFDREDIQQLTIVLDDIVDLIHATAKRIELYKIHLLPESVIKLAEINHKACIELQKTIHSMRQLRYTNAIRNHLIAITAYENEADQIMNNALADLFLNEPDAMQILKLQEIIDYLESATDKCEDAGDVIESVMVKFS